MKRLGIATALLLGSILAGCSESAPEISDTSATPNPATIGSTVNLNFTVSDSDGLEGWDVEVRLLRPIMSAIPSPTLPEAPANAAALAVTLLFQLAQTAPAGEYTFEIVALDGDGNESEPAEIDLTVQ